MRRAWRGLGPEAAVLALAAVLRLAALGRVPTNPYYDAAVRSMGTSWAAFLSGAFEPGRRVAIDKPPVDLWLQVASTRLLGFNGVALLAPEALGGIALVAALMWLLRTLLGRPASLAGGLALAVAPSAVIVARSDTMDAVMAALAVAGAAVVARAARSGSRWPLVGAGVLLGLAFEVKLAEALLPVAAAAALWWFAGPRAPRPRAVGLGLLGGAFVASALAWLVVVSVVPLHPRPWALGSSDGSPWRAALVYNGTARLLGGGGNAPSATGRAAGGGRGVAVADAAGAGAGRELAASPGAPASRPAAAALARRAREHAAAVARRPAPAGPLRLLSAQAHLGRWIGIEAVAALAALAVALALGGARGLGRLERGGLLALALWLVAGLALCSAMPGLRPRYLACVDPAVAACLGAGVALAVRARPRPARLAGAAALCAVLALPLATAAAAVSRGVQVSGRTGAMPAARVAALSGFLRAHAAGAADEVAVSAPSKAGPLIARDGRPVLILSDGQGNQLVSPAALAQRRGRRPRALRAARRRLHGEQRQRAHRLPARRAMGAGARGRRQPRGRPAARRRALRAQPAAGRPRREAAEELPRPPRRCEGCGRRRGSAGRRASRGPGRRGARARRASRRCNAARRSRSPRARAQPIRLPLAAVDAPPLPQPPLHAAVVVGRLAAVGHDLVGGAVDLEDRQRALGLARRQRAVAAGDRRRAREALGEIARRAAPSCRRRSTRP